MTNVNDKAIIKSKDLTSFFLRATVVFVLLTLLGCGTWYPAQQKDVVPPKEQPFIDHITNYKLGETYTTFIGKQTIFVQQFTATAYFGYDYKKTGFVDSNIKIKAARNIFWYYDIEAVSGKEYKINKLIEINGINYNVIEAPDNHGTTWGILCDDSGNIFHDALYNEFYKMLFYPTIMTMSPAACKISETQITATYKNVTLRDPILSYELIYTGKNDVSLNFLYREYTGKDFARPAFTQNLTYQANANQIRFKDYVFKIHKATNEQITYTILEDGIKSVSE